MPFIQNMIRKSPLSFVAATIGSSAALGIVCYCAIAPPDGTSPNSKDLPLTENQAQLQAMLDITREQSWKENLSLAMDAKNLFFEIPSSRSARIDEIFERKKKLLKEDKQKGQDPEKFW